MIRVLLEVFHHLPRAWRRLRDPTVGHQPRPIRHIKGALGSCYSELSTFRMATGASLFQEVPQRLFDSFMQRRRRDQIFPACLLHHGMVIMGCPYSDPGLAATEGGGTPYGPTHLDAQTLRPHEHDMAVRLGERLAKWSRHD